MLHEQNFQNKTIRMSTIKLGANEAIRVNNDAVNSMLRDPAKALKKLRRAMRKIKGEIKNRERNKDVYTDQEDDHDQAETPGGVDTNPYKYDEGMDAFAHPQKLSLVAHDEDIQDDKLYIEAIITFNHGICCSLLGQFYQAEDYFIDTHCILSSRNLNRDDDKKLHQVTVHLNEGHNYYRAGKYDEALDAYWDAIHQAETEKGSEMLLGAALNCVGVVKFTSVVKENGDSGSSPTPTSNDGDTFGNDISKFDESISALNNALSLVLQTHAPEIDSPQKTRQKELFMATIVNNIGRVRYCIEDHEGALPFFKKAYTVRLAHFGAENLDVCMSALNVGLCLHKVGEADEAMTYYRHYIDVMLTDQFRSYLDDFVGLVTLIAEMWHSINDQRASIAFFQIALKSAKQHYGEISYKVTDILNQFGNACYVGGNSDLALSLYEEELEVERKLLPLGHINHAVTLSNIAAIHDEQGSPHLALPRYNEALDIFKSSNNYKIPAAKTLIAIGVIQIKSLEAFKDASDTLQEALSMQENISDDIMSDEEASSILHLLSDAYAEQNRFQLSLTYAERSLQIRRNLNMPHSEISTLLYKICDLLVDKFGNSERALKYYHESLQLECSHCNCELTELLETLERIGKIYEALCEPRQAIAFYIQAAFVCEKSNEGGAKRQKKNLSRYLVQVGNSYLEVGDVPTAIKSFSRAMHLDSDECKEQFHHLPFSQDLYKFWVKTTRGASAA